MGILSLVASVTCLGLVLGPAAVYLGSKASQRIAASGGSLSGNGLARAGVILGVIGIVEGVVFFVSFASAVATFRSLI